MTCLICDILKNRSTGEKKQRKLNLDLGNSDNRHAQLRVQGNLARPI